MTRTPLLSTSSVVNSTRQERQIKTKITKEERKENDPEDRFGNKFFQICNMLQGI